MTDANDPKAEAAFQAWFGGGVDDAKKSLPYARFIREQLTKVLAAADAARPVVSDEEVVTVINLSAGMGEAVLRDLRAAGFDVVRR